MSTNYTEHLGLTLWEANDPVLRTEFNANNQKLDTVLSAMPRIAVGSYVGTGDSGAATPNTLTFDFTPMMVVIAVDSLNAVDPGTVMIRGQSGVPGFGYLPSSTYSMQIHVDWKNNGLSWYNDNDHYNQLNAFGCTYCYFAIGV